MLKGGREEAHFCPQLWLGYNEWHNADITAWARGKVSAD